MRILKMLERGRVLQRIVVEVRNYIGASTARAPDSSTSQVSHSRK